MSFQVMTQVILLFVGIMISIFCSTIPPGVDDKWIRWKVNFFINSIYANAILAQMSYVASTTKCEVSILLKFNFTDTKNELKFR